MTAQIYYPSRLRVPPENRRAALFAAAFGSAGGATLMNH